MPYNAAAKVRSGRFASLAHIAERVHMDGVLPHRQPRNIDRRLHVTRCPLAEGNRSHDLLLRIVRYQCCAHLPRRFRLVVVVVVMGRKNKTETKGRKGKLRKKVNYNTARRFVRFTRIYIRWPSSSFGKMHSHAICALNARTAYRVGAHITSSR